jgi:hypothetical protein
MPTPKKTTSKVSVAKKTEVKKAPAKKAAPTAKKKDYGKLALALHKKLHGK